jgi:hypothetical protein
MRWSRKSLLPWEAKALDGLELPSFDFDWFGFSGTVLLLEMLKILKLKKLKGA